MTERVLFVDDEPAVLDGYKRTLYKDFSIHTAVGGKAGLVAMREQGPFAIVVSDMRMPEMSGSEFLRQARDLEPATVRMLLTGYSNTEEAAAAVNDGNIFRYLNKPCSKEELAKALQLGLAHYRMQQAEKDLLEGTLLGSIRALSEVLGAVNAPAFGRATRVSICVRHLLSRASMDSAWQAEAAAMLSQVGCLALPAGLLRAAHWGEPLSAEEQALFNAHPANAQELIAHIPRMQWVGWIVQRQIYSPSPIAPADASRHETEQLQLGGEMLRLAVAYDTYWLRGMEHADIVFQLRQAMHSFPHPLLDALETMKPVEKTFKPARLPVNKLTIDMVIHEDVRSTKGTLLLGEGQPITRPILLKLRQYVGERIVADDICVLVNAA